MIMWIKATILGLGFVAFVTGMLALTLKNVAWMLGAAEWIAVWCTDWRDEYRKWGKL